MIWLRLRAANIASPQPIFLIFITITYCCMKHVCESPSFSIFPRASNIINRTQLSDKYCKMTHDFFNEREDVNLWFLVRINISFLDLDFNQDGYVWFILKKCTLHMLYVYKIKNWTIISTELSFLLLHTFNNKLLIKYSNF